MTDRTGESVVDPDYCFDIDQNSPCKKRKIDHDHEKNIAIEKIKGIINNEFKREINSKEEEIENISERIIKVQELLDRLRACVAAGFYSIKETDYVPNSNTPSSFQQSGIHPTIKNSFCGKQPKEHLHDNRSPQFTEKSDVGNIDEECAGVSRISEVNDRPADVEKTVEFRRASHFKQKCRVLVGNVSRYIAADRRCTNDASTHKWMIYVRSAKDQPPIQTFIKKVWFFLHPSYKPNDLVEVAQHPFHLTRRGWGEFPVRVQLHFQDSRNKSVDIIHNLKLDKTYTGLQTFGAETLIDMLLYKQNGSDKCAPKTINDGDVKESNNTVIAENKPNLSAADPTESKLINDRGRLPDDRRAAEEGVSSNPKERTLNSPNTSGDNDKVPVAIDRVGNPSIVKLAANNLNGLQKFLKCKDQSGNIILVPIDGIISKSGANATTIRRVAGDRFNGNSLIGNKSPNGTMIKSSKVNGLARTNSNVLYVKHTGSLQTNRSLLKSHVSILKSSASPPGTPLTCNVETRPTFRLHGRSDSRKKAAVKIAQAVEPVQSVINEDSRSEISSFEIMDDLVKFLVKKHPLISETADRRLHHYCCKDLETFYRWPVGKQRACEWQRARAVAKSIKKLITDHWNLKLSIDRCWTTKRVLIWSRRFAYTPMNSELNDAEGEESYADADGISPTLSDPTTFIQNLRKKYDEQHDKTVVDVSDEEIDIVGEMNKVDESRMKVEPKSEDDGILKLPSRFAGSEFVRQSASQIGIKLHPVEVVPKVFAPVSEDIIFQACKSFAEELIRSSVCAAFDQADEGTFPSVVRSHDVIRSIVNDPTFDFLTLNNMGVKRSSQDSNS